MPGGTVIPATVSATGVKKIVGSLAPVRQSLPYGTASPPSIVRPRDEGRP